MTTPSGEPTLRPGLDPASVTPGTLGFLATLLIVVLVIFLIRDMVKRVRRVRYTAEVQQNREQRDAAAGNDAEGTPPEEPGRPFPGGKHGPDNR
jgi:hypothetical protein